MSRSYTDLSLDWCPRAVVGLCTATIFVACLTLLGWAFNNDNLKSISASYEPLMIVTAIWLILCSFSVILIRHENASSYFPKVAKAIAFFVLIANIVEIFTFNGSLEKFNLSIPFSTHLSLIFFSTCICLIDNVFFNQKKIFSFFIAIIIFLSLISLLGYLFIKDPDYKIVTLTRMSIYTSLSFFMLCLALLLARPHTGIAYRFLDKTTDAALLRRIPLLFIATITLAFITNTGQSYDLYDDGFSDLLSAMISMILLMGLLILTLNKLRLQEKRILAQHEIAKIMESGKKFQDISSSILEIICTQLDWDIGEIRMIDKSSNLLEYFSSWHNKSIDNDFITQLNNIQFKKGSGVPGKAWEDQHTLWKMAANQPLDILTSTKENIVFRTVVALPILSKNKILGILNLFSKKINTKTEAMQQFLEVTAISLGEYISHQSSEEKMILMIDQDHLTGLNNRSVFEEILQNIIDNHSPLFCAVIVLDIDKFKWVNEMFDYDIGDDILKIIVNRLQKFSEEKYISRLAGNTFAIILNTLGNLNQLTHLAYEMLSEIKQPIEVKGKSISLSSSIGISLFPKDGQSAKSLLKNAEIAKEKAKLEAGDNFQFYTEELLHLKSEQLTIITELKDAISRNELSLYFQPKINVQTGHIISAESLIRWKHPTRGLLSPNIFMPIAEENNLVIPMTEWIISECCNIINTYKLNIPIAINLSGEHFKESFNLIGYLNQILKGFHINSNQIELEITETVFMNESKESLSVLVDLKRMGFKIAIDDFGTGFSSLSYLKNIAADYIKIDKSFIDNIPNNIDSVIITKAIMDLSHALGKKIIAEGVETLEQVQFLVNENCDQIQGYYFSKPLPIEDLMIYLQQGKKWDIPNKIQK
jgi:diguanylate cyclase (GGDEF)-like protein